MKNLSYFPILVLFFLLGCTKETPLTVTSEDKNAIDPGKASRPDDLATAYRYRPFKGRADMMSVATTSTRCSDSNPALATVALEGSGVMTHLGRMTVTLTQCVDRLGITQSPLVITQSEGTFTAAFGDQVYFTGNGGLIPTGNPLVFNIHVECIITGGTGYFASAQGNFTVTGAIVFPNFPPMPGDPSPDITNVYNGTIAY